MADLRCPLDGGMDIDALNLFGQSALSQVVDPKTHIHIEQMESIIHLINSGADVHIPCQSERMYKPMLNSPLWCAIIGGHIKLVAFMLRKQPIRGNTRATEARYLHKYIQREMSKLPYEKGFRILPDSRNKRVKDTMPNKGIIKMLLAAGADDRQKNSNGDTPLAVLIRCLIGRTYSIPCVIQLIKPLSRGVDLNDANVFGESIGSLLQDRMEHFKLIEKLDKPAEKAALGWPHSKHSSAAKVPRAPVALRGTDQLRLLRASRNQAGGRHIASGPSDCNLSFALCWPMAV
ncbi:hypothetical protein B0H63DRAFT_184817 [Podospora didyma]|uniref:Ankyrin repeat protein n=1 Tax=Podospora didyma TaxID=330526 RepID=A0AAE0TZP7_9PEZI|nr:hypothetical protein B0H63DRAFT_184817 [Podospora didyma]